MRPAGPVFIPAITTIRCAVLTGYLPEPKKTVCNAACGLDSNHRFTSLC